MPRDLTFDGLSEEAREAARTARALIMARLSTIEGNTAEEVEFSSRQAALVVDEIEASDDPERAWRLLILALIRAGATAVWEVAQASDISQQEAAQRLFALWETKDFNL